MAWVLAVGPAVAPRAEAGEEHGARGGHTRLYARSRARTVGRERARAVVGSTSRVDARPRYDITAVAAVPSEPFRPAARGPAHLVNVKSAIAGRA